MNCSRFRHLVSPYLDQDLSYNEQKEFNAHQEHCSQCGELVSHLIQIKTALKEGIEVSLSPGFVVNLQDRLQAETDQGTAWWRRLFEPRLMGLSPVSLSGMAAATIAVVIIAVSLFQPETAPLLDPPAIAIPQEAAAGASVAGPGGDGATSSSVMSSANGDSVIDDQTDSDRRDYSRYIRNVSQDD